MNDDDNTTEPFDSMLNAILKAFPVPEIIIRSVDEEDRIISELVFTNTMPECVVCGGSDADESFQDPRFMDGQTLCEFCYVPRVIEWERTHQ